jgi:hypothetical protein
MADQPIPAASVPFLDPDTGRVDRTWYTFLQSLRGAAAIAAATTDIDNTQLSDMAAWTIKMRNNAATGDPQDVTINGLTEETSIDGSADFDPFWDTSGGVMRKRTPTNVFRTGGYQLLNSGSVTSASTLSIVLTSFTAFPTVKLVLTSFVPATDDVELHMLFSTDGGGTYASASYSWGWVGIRDGSTTPIGEVSASDSKIVVAGRGPTANQAISNVASEGGADVEITLHARTSTARYTAARISSEWHSADSQGISSHGHGKLESAADTDAVRFLMESGNIASGNWALYGLVA